MKFCTNCGLQVSQDVSFCPRCGAFIPPKTSSSASLPAVSPSSPEFISHNGETQAAGVGASQEGTLAAMPLAYDMTESASTNAGTVETQKEDIDYGFQMYPATPTPSAQPREQPVFLPPPPPLASVQQPSYAPYESHASPTSAFVQPAPPPSPPLRPQRSGMSSGMIILCAVLAVLVLLGGVGLIMYAAVIHPAQLHAQATATVQAIQTSNARATAVANAQATGTAVANANATATAQAQATAQAEATAAALQAIYTQAVQGTPALTSSLAGQDGNNWDEYQTTDGGGCAFTGGALHATLYSQHFYVPCFAQSSNYSNFAFQVQMTINKGDEGGLVFRADDQNAKFYLFTVSHDGTYALYLSKDNNHNMSIAYGSSSSINTNYGQSNLLTVIARGSTIYLYINKQYASSVSDGTYTSGKIGVFASDNTNNTDVAFNNAQVWTL